MPDLNQSPPDISYDEEHHNAEEYDYSAVYKSPQGIAVHRQWYEQKLQKLQLKGVERLVLNTRFGPTHLLAVGPLNAPPLVLIHSALESAFEWQYQLHYFAQAQTHRVYALDLPGHSAPSAPVRLSTTKMDYAIWLLEVLYRLNLKRADFVGLSFGCGVIIKLAGLVPSRINSVVLINPMGLAGLRTLSSPWVFFISVAALLFPKPLLVRQVIKAYCSPQSHLEEATINETTSYFQLIRKYLKLDELAFSFSDAELASLTVPGLMLLGQHNRVRKTADTIARTRRLLPAITIELVPNAGNSPELEQPAYLTQAIVNFLGYIAACYGPPPASASGATSKAGPNDSSVPPTTSPSQAPLSSNNPTSSPSGPVALG